MSTYLEPSANSATGVCVPRRHFSLGLTALLESRTSSPSLPQLFSWLANTQISEDELKTYLGFKEGTYWRHGVCRTEFVEMLVLCWRPGQRTVIHDHNGSQGAVLVQQGVMWETTFTYSEELGLRYNSACGYETGQLTGADVPDIHQLGNPDVSEQNLVTIHIYSHLWEFCIHTPGSPGWYTPVEPD